MNLSMVFFKFLATEKKSLWREQVSTVLIYNYLYDFSLQV